MISSKRDRVWVGLKYERIVGLCYSCGRLGHEMKARTHRRPSDNAAANAETPYREWLKIGGRQRMEEPSQGSGGTQSKASPQEENPSKLVLRSKKDHSEGSPKRMSQAQKEKSS